MKKLFLSGCLGFLTVLAFASGHTVTISSTNASCYGVCNGTSAFSVSGGTGPFSFQWADSSGFASTAQNIVGLCAGTYTVTVTDSSDMSAATASVLITQPSFPNFITGTTNPSCGLNNGIIGTVAGCTYNWTCSAPPNSGVNFTGLQAGTYTVNATCGGCVYSDTVNLVNSPVPSVTSPSYTICNGSSVSLIPTVTGGTPGYTFSWSPAGSGSSISVSPSTTTTYTVMVTDANGCSANATTVVTVNPQVTVTISTTNTSSCNSSDGTGNINATGGTFPYIYTWGSIPSGSTYSFSALPAGTYPVVVSDSNGCYVTTTATVNTDIITNFTMVPDSINALTFLGFNSSSSNSILNYFWSFGDSTYDSTATSPIHTYAASGIYSVCLNSIESLTGGCNTLLCQNLNVTGTLSSCLALFNIADDTSSTDPNAYTVTNLSYGSALTYLWDFGDTTSSTLQDPTHVYSTSSGPYQICLTVDNGAGCSQTYCDSIFSVDSISRTSSPISFTVVEAPPFPLATSNAEKQVVVGIKIYPNPFTDQTTFMISSEKLNETYSFEMTDVLGKVVRRIKTSEKQFSVSRSGLESGIYFYKVYTAKTIVGIGKVNIN